MTTKKKSDDPFEDQDFKPASEKTPEEAGVQEPAGGSALSPVLDEDGNPTNFPPITNKDAAPWDPDIPAPGEPQVYGRGNIEAAKAAQENAYTGEGVPDYQKGTLNKVEEDQVTSHLGGLTKDGKPVTQEDTLEGEPAPDGDPDYPAGAETTKSTKK